MAARSNLRGGVTATMATCLCGRLATERSEAGRYFCAEHLPRRAPVPPPRPAPPSVPAPGPRQGELFDRT
ncbi:hypothetical protein [Methylobacterium oryzihabitans]|uniref:Uncharacterized protein n=1 Tax=Methylobacterium oryzihabitans TaxID=2499852 RepID=A0A3S2V5N1_9HYPH|nr:hypothetical protein [Methylobacterium oryzihabitans]RVU14938.1 hypothetical protein EOE48_21180 [Methylobacterium oryzihabitans]